jgi:hypothetical protein
MNAHKLAATLNEDGTLLLKGLPFHAGNAVEIIILEQPKEQLTSPPRQTEYPLQGKQPYRYDEPFEPAVPAEDNERLSPWVGQGGALIDRSSQPTACCSRANASSG